MKQGLFAELKRRHVYRVAVAYAVVGWLVIQAGTTVVPLLHLPDTLNTMILVLVALGFPIALILAWAFEMTPEGMRRTEPADSPEARQADQHRKIGRTLDRIIIGVLLVTVGLLLANTFIWHKGSGHEDTAAQAPGKSIAVLPFENLSNDKANGYFSDGIQDLILTKLADIGDLKVVSRTSTMKYGSHPENLQSIGKQLGVATILEGSVQRVGDQVLVNVQLIDTRHDSHIWANSYRRTLKDVFSVEGEVASKIAATLNAKLSPAETRRLATTLSGNAEANDIYLRGEYFANRGDVNYDTASMKQAIGYYRQAIAMAPEFAQARARLSMYESRLAWFGGGGSKAATLYSDAREQAEQALKLAPDLADAHLALGYYNYYGQGNYTEALKAFSAGLELRPNDSDALAAQAFVLRRQGKFDDAIDSLEKALILDPRNTALAFETGYTYMAASRYSKAIQAFQRALALDPTNVNAMASSGLAMLFSNGDLEHALAEVQGDNAHLKLWRVGMLVFAHRYVDALALLKSIPDTPDTFPAGKSLLLAHLYQLSGDSAKAHALFAKALPESRALYAKLKGSPAINQGLALINVVQAELGLGQTSAGLADIAKVQAIAENSPDHMYAPQLMLGCAQGYAYANRADKAVSLLSKALTAPGIGTSYSPVLLWLDPSWDPIRKNSGFQALEKKYAKYRPANLPMETKG